MVSREFIAAVKLSSRYAYEIAHAAEMHPATLSKLLSGAEPIRPNDPRVLRVAQVLGLDPAECFEECEPAPKVEVG